MNTLSKKGIGLITAAVLLLGACTKPAGPGGRAMVKGKVFAKDYDNTQSYVISREYSPGEKVYIVYGNSSYVGNKTETSNDGSFAFLYLNKGHYKVFVNSLDTSIKVKGNKTYKPVVKEFDIKNTKDVIDLGDIIIAK